MHPFLSGEWKGAEKALKVTQPKGKSNAGNKQQLGSNVTSNLQGNQGSKGKIYGWMSQFSAPSPYMKGFDN